MITIHLDGERMEVGERIALGSIIPHHPHGCSVAIIRPSTQEQAEDGYSCNQHHRRGSRD